MPASKDNDTRGSGLVRTSARKREPEAETERESPKTQKTQRTEKTQKAQETRKAPKARISAAEVAGAGLRQIAELTGREAISVTSIKAVEDGWLVEVEAVEDRRIPSSGDLLGLYEAQLAEDGALVGYRRKKRYTRGWGDKGDGT